MKKSDFYYELPQELIAQSPIEPRNYSRLLVLNKETGEISHTVFDNLDKYLKAGDCLVLNNTRVLPAKIQQLHLYLFVCRKFLQEVLGYC